MNTADNYVIEIGYKTLPVIVNAKQGDKGYELVFTIMQYGVLVPDHTTDTAKVHVGKPDGHFSWVDATVNDDDTVSVVLTEQMLTVAGRCYADITLYEGDTVRSTFNFILQVEPKPSGSGIPSQTEFQLLEDLIEETEMFIHTTYSISYESEDDAIIITTPTETT